MKVLHLLALFLMGSVLSTAVEECADSNSGSQKALGKKAFETWDFGKAVRALGRPPGPVTQATYDMLRRTWEQKSYTSRRVRQHAQMDALIKNGNTTDLNTWMMSRANAVWMNHQCGHDRRLFFAHLLRPYEKEKPQELPHHLDWIASFAYHELFPTEYLLGIVEAQQGIPAFYTGRRNVIYGKQSRAAEVSRLWSDPVTHAPYIMWHGSDFARQALRFLLHDSSAIYESACRSGLTCWEYTWGKDLPEPIALGLQLMQNRSCGKLPTAAELEAIRRAATGLPPEMQNFVVRNMLVADPACMPWKKLDDPEASLAEMPDCSAVLTPQWSDELLGGSGSLGQDIAALEQLVVQEQEADMLSSLVLFTLAEGSRIRRDHEFKQEIPTQGHYRYSSTFEVEVSENGIDVLIDEKGPRFAHRDDELRRRCHRLNVALHRCALHLALLERDGRMDELKKYAAELAELLNRQRIWPLLINEAALRQLSPECMVQLLHHCKADSRILRSMVTTFNGGNKTNVYCWAELVTTRRNDEDKPEPEPELLASFLRDYLMVNELMPCTPQQRAEMQKRLLELDDRFPRQGIAESMMQVGAMNEILYTPELDASRISGECSRRGYFLIRHALQRGERATAERLFAGMTSAPAAYRHTGTRLAAALIARARGDEAAAREHERLGIIQAAMHQQSYYTFHWADAHRVLLEHGLTHASERLLMLLPERDLLYVRPVLVRKLAEQRRFRSAAFAAEMLLARFCSNAAPISGRGSHADLVSWRLQADVYHALALLQQGCTREAQSLLDAAMLQLERMPHVAALLAPSILHCADIPVETRREYHRRLLRGTAGCATLTQNLQQMQLLHLPTVDESAELTALKRIREPEGIKPLESPVYTWHLQKEETEDTAAGADERTATRVTVDACILSTNYEALGKAPWVELRTESGRKLKVPFSELQADDLANIIDWKERNNIRTWTYRKTEYTGMAPFDARLDRLVQGRAGGVHLRHNIDVSDGRLAEFTCTDGRYFRLHVNLLDDESVACIEQLPIEKMTPHLHTDFSEAEADARRRDVSLRFYMLGKRGGPEEAAFLHHLESDGENLQEYNVLLPCYKDENGEWDANGKEAMKLLMIHPELYETPGENYLDGGFSFYVSGFSNHLPAISLFRYGQDAWQDPDYRNLVGAIQAGRGEEAERILDAHPELLKVHSYYHGMTGALHVAILNKRVDIAEMLLKRGANPNDRNTDGQTMLYAAVCRNSPELVRLLVRYGARTDLPSPTLGGCTPGLPLFAAANKPETAKALLELGVDANQKDTRGEDVVHTLLSGNMKLDVENLMALVRVMVAAGWDINATDALGRSALFMVAKCACDNAYYEPSRVPPLLDAMKELIDLGADPEETAFGRPPLLERLSGYYDMHAPRRALPPEVEKILREYRRKQ